MMNTNYSGCKIETYDINQDKIVQGVLSEEIAPNLYSYILNTTLKPISMLDDEVGIKEASELIDLDADEFEFVTDLNDEHYDLRDMNNETRFFLGSPTGKKRDRAIQNGWGSMETPSMFRNIGRMNFIFDCGMFAYHMKNEAFDDKLFLKRLDTLYVSGQTPEFVVLPDTIGNWEATKESTFRWLNILTERFGDRFSYAMVLQEGCTKEELDTILDFSPEIKWLFVGGKSNFAGFGKKKVKAREWKFDFAEEAIPVAKKHGVKVHIGRVSSIAKVRMATALKADTMDSSMPNFSPQQFDRYERGMISVKRQGTLELFT